jgi:cytochrome c
VWDAQTLEQFLANPQQEVPGNRMPFSGVPDATTRADIAAYLASLR